MTKLFLNKKSFELATGEFISDGSLTRTEEEWLNILPWLKLGDCLKLTDLFEAL